MSYSTVILLGKSGLSYLLWWDLYYNTFYRKSNTKAMHLNYWFPTYLCAESTSELTASASVSYKMQLKK